MSKRVKTTTADRPGSMDKKYKAKLTNALGRIYKYNDKYKTLIFMFDDGSSVSITYGTFKRDFEEA